VSAAYAITRPGGDIELIGPYNADFITDLKRRVPHWHRVFDPETKAWAVDSAYASTAVSIARRWYGAVETLSTSSLGTSHYLSDCLQRVRAAYPDHAILQVLPGAAAAVVQGAYRALVREHHPDIAGASGHTATVRLNQAYAAVVELGCST